MRHYLHTLTCLVLALGLAGAAPVPDTTPAPASSVDAAREAVAKGEFQKGLEIASQAASQGDPAAALIIARLHDGGHVTNASVEEAISWYRRAAKAGNANAQLELGLVLSRPDTPYRDPAGAAAMFRAAADQGNAAAEYNLGISFAGGEGVRQDWVEAAQWLEKAAAQDHVEAIYGLGTLYDEGLGVKADPIEAARLIGIAARAGLLEAELDYATMAASGRGVQKDQKVAALWFESAARKGNAVAQNRLARMHVFGFVEDPSDLEAAKWHILAQRGGVSDPMIDMALANMPAGEREKAESAAAAFEPEKSALAPIRGLSLKLEAQTP